MSKNVQMSINVQMPNIKLKKTEFGHEKVGHFLDKLQFENLFFYWVFWNLVESISEGYKRVIKT